METREIFTVAQFNIDATIPKADNPNRADVITRINHAADIIDGAINPDIIIINEGTQQALRRLQYNFSTNVRHYLFGQAVDQVLEPGRFDFVGVNLARFTVVSQDSLYLSTTPRKPSKSWKSYAPRTATFVGLEDRWTKEHVLVVGCHLDNMSQFAREMQIREVLRYIQALKLPEGTSVIIAGDMNSSYYTFPGHEDTSAVHTMLDDQGFLEMYRKLHPDGQPPKTYDHYEGDAYQGTDYLWNPDHIYARGSLEVTSADVLNLTPGGVRVSDHRPTRVELRYT